MSSKAYQTHIKTEAASGDQVKGRKSKGAKGIPHPQLSERERVLEKLKARRDACH